MTPVVRLQVLGLLEFHVVHAVTGWIGCLVGGNRHADLGATEAAAVLQLHLAELDRKSVV